MKKLLLPVFIILISTLLIAVIPTEADAAIYEDTVRLHIIAPSDSTEDQNLKLEIRDRLLEKYSTALIGSQNADEARDEVLKNLKEIEYDCNLWIEEAGFDYKATAELSKESYGTREYAAFSLPAGEYTSLKITIGKGEGANWWCVMYPPMCLDICLSEEVGGYTDEEYRLISQSGYRVKFKTLELISELTSEFRKNRKNG